MTHSHDHWLEALAPHRVGLSTGLLPHGSWPPLEQEEETGRSRAVFDALASELTSPPFCRVPLVTQTNPDLMREGPGQGYVFQEAGYQCLGLFMSLLMLHALNMKP